MCCKCAVCFHLSATAGSIIAAFIYPPQIALGSVRLSIIGLKGGHQPIHNENKSLWIVLNGEIFDYMELRFKLKTLAYRLSTHNDTDVILHLYEESGLECLRHINGPFG